ncbi:MAG: glucosyl-3-phosphoglycerate synthase, partial [Acidimicrobiales bacterium]
MARPAPRTSHHSDHQPRLLAGLKAGRRVSVCLPARDEEATVGLVVGRVREALVEAVPLVDEVLVVDDGSMDATAAVARAAGARVVRASDVLPEEGGGAGKGQAMWKAVAEADGDLLVFCDADVHNFGPHFVTGLLGPLLAHDDVALVKGFYERPLDGRAGQGGRVTELVARPLIATLFPHLAGIAQPLAGETAGRREVLEQVPFAHGYGVELGLLLDVGARYGVRALAQVDLGVRVHRNRPLHELGPQALAVLQVALDRAGVRRPGQQGA